MTRYSLWDMQNPYSPDRVGYCCETKNNNRHTIHVDRLPRKGITNNGKTGLLVYNCKMILLINYSSYNYVLEM